ncbi:11363_t:CDS:2, partial [Racocetra fulgida]
LPMHLFVEKGLELMEVLEKVDNKPIENLQDPHNVYVTAYNEAQKVFRNPFYSIIPIEHIPILRRLVYSKVDRLSNLFEDFIKEKRKSLAAGQSNGDLLEHMIKACEDPDNPTLSDVELRDVQRKAREEVLKILGDDLTPSAEHHASLKYLNMIIRENLRLYPPVPSLTLRVLTEDLKYNNFLIPAGTPIALFLYGIQNSPKLWENPNEFLPE